MIKRYVYAALFLAAGGIALWMAFHVGGEIAAKRDWPAVPGKILERRVGEPMGKGRNYIPYVKYTYEVGGKRYTNDQVWLIERTGDLHDKVQELVDGLPDPVPVRHDPANPADSYLLVNPTGTKWILFAFGALALLMGLATLLVALTKKPA